MCVCEFDLLRPHHKPRSGSHPLGRVADGRVAVSGSLLLCLDLLADLGLDVLRAAGNQALALLLQAAQALLKACDVLHDRLGTPGERRGRFGKLLSQAVLNGIPFGPLISGSVRPITGNSYYHNFWIHFCFLL